MKAIINAKIINSGKIINGYNLLFSKRIIALTQQLPIWAEVIDAKGAYLSAGFIDIHIHGSAGADVMDANEDALKRISKSILQTGTTAYLATTMTMSSSSIIEALKSIKEYRSSVGAKLLGVHLEGPFINPSKHGAQNPSHIQLPNLKPIQPYMDIIKMITLAPEIENAQAFIAHLKTNYPNILLSIGHSNATFEETQQSIDWGISHATHLFNAMNPLHHRKPGVVGAILANDKVSCDLIADMIHVHPAFFNLIYKLKRDQLILITDAMRAGCLECGEYDIGGQKAIVKNGEARLLDGTLAGSVLRINDALKNFYQHTDITLPELISMVTSTPAKKLGLKMGEIKEDYPADLVLFDQSFNILKTFVDGKISYTNQFFDTHKE
jgi:N-acetylglucosamine-6-phosphate deacetylase